VSYLVSDSNKQVIILNNLNRIKDLVSRYPGSSFLPVTKKKSIDIICVAIEWGVLKIGENYLQEAIPKIEEINKRYPGNKINWHFIGTIQSNKAKKIAANFDVIETVSKEKIFSKIVDQARVLKKKVSILIEVNISEESSKSGLHYNELESFLESINVNQTSNYEPVTVDGFMTMGKAGLSPAEKKEEFGLFVKRMKNLRRKFPAIGDQLSFGMSDDFLIALEEGSTQVRLGTLLFGERK